MWFGGSHRSSSRDGDGSTLETHPLPLSTEWGEHLTNSGFTWEGRDWGNGAGQVIRASFTSHPVINVGSEDRWEHTHGWPLSNMGFNCAGSLNVDFFPINTVNACSFPYDFSNIFFSVVDFIVWIQYIARTTHTVCVSLLLVLLGRLLATVVVSYGFGETKVTCPFSIVQRRVGAPNTYIVQGSAEY